MLDILVIRRIHGIEYDDVDYTVRRCRVKVRRGGQYWLLLPASRELGNRSWVRKILGTAPPYDVVNRALEFSVLVVIVTILTLLVLKIHLACCQPGGGRRCGGRIDRVCGGRLSGTPEGDPRAVRGGRGEREGTELK